MTEQCVADGGLINPALFPAKSADLDPSRVNDSATGLRTMGTAVADKTGTVKTTWDRLSGCYRAPEQEKVFAVMSPAVTSAGELKSHFSDVAKHLDTYASALAGIKPRLADLERRAREFRASVIDGVWVDASDSADAGFGDHVKWAFDWVPGVDERRVKVPWNEDGDTVQKNTDLLEEYGRILADISTASATCANAVNGLVTNMCVAPVEAIPAEAFTNPEAPMPWGNPVVEDRNCRESVGHGGYEWGKGLVQGVGMLVVGYNPENGDWFSGDAYGQSWGGLGDLVGSLVLMASPVGWVAAGMAATGNNNNGFSDFMYDRAVVLRNAGGSLVGWDPNAKDGWHQWKEDGLATGTGTVLNIGTLFIPGAGEVSAGLKATSIAAKLAKITGGITEFAVQGGSWAVKGGVKVIVGLKVAIKGFDLDEILAGMRGNQLAVAGAGGGLRLNAGGLFAAMTDAGHAAPNPVRPHTPLSDAAFGPRGGGVPDVTPHPHGPGATVPHVDPPSTGGAPGTPPVHDPHTGTGTGTGTDGTTPHQPATGGHAPEWTGGHTPDGRPDVTQVPREHWNDPQYDPSHPHYDGTPRGEHGNVGTVDPDVPSSSGLTHSGRLLDPDVVPEQLRPYVENGTLVNDDGVLRLAEPIEVDFTRRNAGHDLVEFHRQLDLQERALNQMSLENWTERFDSFVSRLDNQGPYRTEQIRLLADRILAEQGVSHPRALELAEQQLARQDPLHGPDQRAGGDPDQFTGMGDRGVNRSIGSQWKTRADDLRLAVRDALRASGIDPALWDDVRLNLDITLTDIVPVRT